MVEFMTEFEAFDIDAHATPEGLAVLTLLTDKGRVSIHMKRSVLENLDHRTKRELSRVAPPAPVRKDAQ
jgi:hypothetical protein